MSARHAGIAWDFHDLVEHVGTGGSEGGSDDGDEEEVPLDINGVGEEVADGSGDEDKYGEACFGDVAVDLIPMAQASGWGDGGGQVGGGYL